MQQTDKYKLNKPGVDDPITPVPLNENMDKIEAAILGKADAVDVTDLDQRLQVFEAKKFATGTYDGMGHTLEFSLGFNPKMVVVFAATAPASNFGILLKGFDSAYGLNFIDGGFGTTNGGYYTQKGYKYYYFAFG